LIADAAINPRTGSAINDISRDDQYRNDRQRTEQKYAQERTNARLRVSHKEVQRQKRRDDLRLSARAVFDQTSLLTQHF
jgi:hypothetical protein